MEVLGIDIGGSGIKAAPVDVTKGTLTRERIKVLTPQPARPTAIAAVVSGLATQFGWSGKASITFPGVVTGRRRPHRAQPRPRPGSGWTPATCSATATGLEVQVINDAEAGRHGGDGASAKRRSIRARWSC